MESEKYLKMFYIAIQFTMLEQSNRRGQHSVFLLSQWVRKTVLD